MPADFIIRPALPDDVPEIVTLWQALQATSARCEPRLAPNEGAAAWFTDYLHGQLDNLDAAVYVAVSQNNVVGYVSVKSCAVRRSRQDCGYVADICVREDLRGEGIGRRLYETLRDWFHARGLRAIEVQVVRANPASQTFWRKMGFGDYLRTLRNDCY